MLTRTIELASVTVLLILGIVWPQTEGEPLRVFCLVCAGSVLAMCHALRAQRRLTAWEFLGVALLFNPVFPVMDLSAKPSLFAALIAIAMIVTCLVAVKTERALSNPPLLGQ
jgi:hypothetical protein